MSCHRNERAAYVTPETAKLKDLVLIIRHIRRDAFMLAGTEIASSPAARE
jgi:hypothetical protein